MSVELQDRPVSETPETETVEREQAKQKAVRKKGRYPHKRTMNLYYKPDRTTKPATIALYVLFVLVCLLGLGKILIYDLWMETEQARQSLAIAEDQLSSVMLQLTDYSEVKERYQRYAATDEERVLIDRMEVLALLESAVRTTADMDTLSISGDTVQLRFSGVTLAQTAQIVRALEASPIVAGTKVNTASTTESETDLVQAYIVIHLQKEASE